MHSSGLRGADFSLRWHGEEVSHGDFFKDHAHNTRVGLVAPEGTEGLGAITLAMSYVTAFYDRCRDAGGDFFAYPDFFTFQRRDPPASYGSFDFWPRKDVLVPADRNATLAAIVDRAVNVLLVQDEGGLGEGSYEPVQLERSRRTITRCFAFGAGGEVAEPDLTISCAVDPFRSYAAKVLGSIRSQAAPTWVRGEVRDLRQSFRELDMDGALARL